MFELFEATPGMSIELVKDSLSPIDLLFAFLGVTTAFGLVARRSEG